MNRDPTSWFGPKAVAVEVFMQEIVVWIDGAERRVAEATCYDKKVRQSDRSSRSGSKGFFPCFIFGFVWLAEGRVGERYVAGPGSNC
ncbi:Hypothetical protein SMAX5B_001325 [Scophthalmus maximus]|uniref:Uncharacterized protein n=1 Tax=Scophthalmus maximus TaxID=52904 RepID=A0A2U9BKS9_SCOMX|nr:Hypothetical protein SMAX5B_001325 [Scophthalmus maximus]